MEFITPGLVQFDVNFVNSLNNLDVNSHVRKQITDFSTLFIDKTTALGKSLHKNEVFHKGFLQ